MSFKIRRRIFWFLFFLFLLAGFAAISYSRGLRLVFQDCVFRKLSLCRVGLQRTGAVFVKTSPKDVIIKLNGELFRDKSGIIQSGTLIENLLTQTYTLEIYKHGYWPWQKNLLVKSGFVTEAKNIILVKEKLGEKNVFTHSLRGKKIEAVSEDGRKVILSTPKIESHFLYNLDDKKTAFNIGLAFQEVGGSGPIKRIAFHPLASQKFIVESSNGLYVLDTFNFLLQKITGLKPASWALDNANIYLAATSSINSFNLIFSAASQLESSLTLKDYGATARLGVSSPKGILALLKNDGEFNIIELNPVKTARTESMVSDFAFAPDGKKLAFLGQGKKLKILFLEDSYINNYKMKDEVAEFDLLDEPLKIAWYKDSEHLFLIYKYQIEFLEIDDREPQNKYLISQGEIDDFYYNRETDTAYILRQGGLYEVNL